MVTAEALGGVLVGRVLLCRALGDESARELSRVLRRAAEARREAGRPLLCWLLVEPAAEAPLPAVCAAILQLTSALMSHCEALALIVIGDGLGQTLLRTALRGRPHTPRVRVVDSLDAAARISGDPALDLAQLERAARAAGLVAALAADTAPSA